MSEFIHLIGIEFEGGFDYPYPSSNYGTMDSDGSIKYIHNSDKVGEFQTKPYPLSEINGVIDACVPQEVNDTCGLHFHISLTSYEYYMRLLHKDFVNLVTTKTAAWAKKTFGEDSYQYERIVNGNSYCLPECQTLDYLLKGPRNNQTRYRHVNFCAFWEHQTVEFRLHPAYSEPQLVKEALEIIVKCIDVYLKLTDPICKDSVKNKLFMEEMCNNDEIVCSSMESNIFTKDLIIIGEIS